MLDVLAHPCFGYSKGAKRSVQSFREARKEERKQLRTNRPTTEYLCRVLRCLLCRSCAIHLQEPNLSGEILALVTVGHLAHLERNILEPILHGFDAGDHCCELGANNRLVEKRLSKDFPLMCPSEFKGESGDLKRTENKKRMHALEALFNNRPLRSRRSTANNPSLMIKIAQYHKDTTVLGTKHILCGDFDIIECDVGRASRGRIGCLDRFGTNTFAPFDEENCQATVCLACYCEIVAEVSVRDPSFEHEGLSWYG